MTETAKKAQPRVMSAAPATRRRKRRPAPRVSCGAVGTTRAISDIRVAAVETVAMTAKEYSDAVEVLAALITRWIDTRLRLAT